ncbi:unnamed protein product, partial [Didymodactylos carnosus]
GYDKIFVAQPRSSWCELLAHHVETKIANVASWIKSDKQSNANANVLYLTDNLLKDYILHNEAHLLRQKNLKNRIIFFIDEIHERSIDIDLCLALLARLLTNKSKTNTKVKIILSSATVDTNIIHLYRTLKELNFCEFTIPSLTTLYPIQIHKTDENVLNLVQRLYRILKPEEQILCFVKSEIDVSQSINCYQNYLRRLLMHCLYYQHNQQKN